MGGADGGAWQELGAEALAAAWEALPVPASLWRVERDAEGSGERLRPVWAGGSTREAPPDPAEGWREAALRVARAGGAEEAGGGRVAAVGPDLVLRLSPALPGTGGGDGPSELGRVLLGASSEAVLLLDPSDRVEEAGGATWAVLGREPRDLRGLGLADLLAEPDPAAPGGVGAEGVEAHARHPDGRLVPVRLRSASRPSRGRALLLADRSDRARLEARRAEERRLEAVGRVASRVAHDLNNLLTVSAASAGLLAPLCPSPPASDLVAELAEATRRCAELTGRMLGLARHGEEGETWVDPASLLARVERLARRLAGPSVEVVARAEVGGWRLRADELALEQALLNLAANAREAMPAGGTLLLSAEAEPGPEGSREGRVRWTVSDTGEGMTPEVRERAFEPFFTTRPPGRGTGLGLASVRDTVRALGGEVELSTAPGAGTTVTLRLPASRAARTERAPRQAASEAPAVLVVEPDPSLLRVVGRGLIRKGLQVWLAGSATEARRLAEDRGRPFDLVVVEAALPDGDGGSLARELGGEAAPRRALLVSGAAPAAPGAGEPLPHLAKPFSVEQLVERLGALAGDGAP